MTDHPTDFELERYAHGTLSAADLLRVDDHLAICPLCRRRALEVADGSRRLASTVHAVRQDLSGAGAGFAQSAEVVPFAPRRFTVGRVTGWGPVIAVAAVAATAVFAVNILWGTRTAPVSAPAPSTPVENAAPQVARADTLTPAERALVDSAAADGRLPRAAALEQVASTTGVLMGSPAHDSTFGPTEPRGVVVDADQPTLIWSSSGAGAQYQVSVFDEAFNLVTSSGWQAETQWRVARPLTRGKSFSWQVKAQVGDATITAPAPPQPEARFLVTTVEQNAQLAAMRKRAGDSHVALAVLLAQAGVLDEAERELTRASAENPNSSAVKRLQASLSELRR